MDATGYIVMFVIGLIGSFFSGLLGIGGAIINYPLLLYVPEWLHAGSFTAKEVSGISMFQVFFSSLAGVIAYKRQSRNEKPLMHKGLSGTMGVSILIGSLAGSVSSKYLPSETINIVYGVLAVIAVIMMLVPSRGSREDVEPQAIGYNHAMASVAAFLVGIVSGIVGAGGSFILIPIMLTVMKIPTRVTIASSLAIVFISAIGGVSGKLIAGSVPLLPTVATVIGSVLGAPIGTRVSRHLNVKWLRGGLAVLIAATAVKIWWSIAAS
ncbi:MULTISPECIES: sulfite exporter TauE/SafE family protein [Paenibacillus]|uniref:Probable membrane transporter protein n=1 Tax=Paenibacillus albilobatus TaxID=2716884 RepID=A0A920C935_9BACL|nr:UPF0721 transmembrane protein YrkJ [Paenibacillus albilobatus]